MNIGMPLHNSADRVLPHNLEAEDGVIASCLDSEDSSLFDTISTIITADDFYSARNRFAFEALQRLTNFGKPLDEIHLCEALKASNTLDEVGGISGLMELMNSATTESQATQYEKLVAEKSNLRKLIRECRIAQEKATSESHDFQDIRSSLEGNILDIDVGSSDDSSVAGSVDEILEDIRLIQEGEYVSNVIKTNVGRLDGFLGSGGIAPGEVLTLAAPTSCGKSAFALYLSAKAMTTQNVPIAYFSFEMPQKQLMKRMIQSISGVNLRSIHDRNATPEQENRFQQASTEAKGLPIHTCHSVKGVDDLVAQCRYFVRKQGVKMVVIDYLQLIPFNGNKMSKSEGIAAISHRIKQMAIELNVAVLLLAQINREGAKRGGALSIYDLKDSGDIENDADVVMMMWPHNGDVESSKDSDHRGPYTGLFYKLAKNREGERDISDFLKFYHCTGRFL